MKKLLLLGAALACGCNNTVVNTPIRTFDRPSDVALACVEFDPTVENRFWNALPLEKCDPNLVPDTSEAALRANPVVRFDPLDTSGSTYYTPELRAVVANSARGELAFVDTLRETIVDTGGRVPGFNFVPVGKLPEHVRATHDGCRAVTANTDSCDLSVVDIPTALNLTLNEDRLRNAGDPDQPTAQLPESAIAEITRELPIVAGGQALRARPSWIEIAPESTEAPSGAPGQCGAASYRAWVALPGCQLVAEVALEDRQATVVRAIHVTRDAASEVTDLGSLRCNDECGGAASAAGDGGAASDAGQPAVADLAVPPADASASPDGGAGSLLPESQAFPGALALDVESAPGQPALARLFIGDLTGERIWVFPMRADSGALDAPRAIPLEAGAAGVSVVRVSPRSEAGKFLYAVARDRTVRVIDLDREVECETNPDPRSPRLRAIAANVDPQPTARELGCFALGDPATPPRSPLFTSPGIVLQGGVLPKDVTFVHLDAPPPPTSASVSPSPAGPSLVVGDFAWILGSDGRTTAVDIYDACPAPNFQASELTSNFAPACNLANAARTRGDDNFKSLPGRPQPLILERLSHRPRSGNARFAQPQNCSDNAGAARLPDQDNPNTVTGTVSDPLPDLGVVPDLAGADLAGAEPDLGVPDLAGGAVDLGSASRLPVNLVVEGFVEDRDPSTAANQHPCTSTDKRSLGVFDIDHVRNETWTLTFEGVVPGTARALGAAGGKPGQAASLFTDAGGQWCTRGVLAGDKLVFTGCDDDDDCDFQQYCARDVAAFDSVTTGLCLPRKSGNEKKAQLELCGPLLRGQRRYRITSAKQGGGTDELQLAEIYEPEHADRLVECTSDSECDGHFESGFDSHGAEVPLDTSCLQDFDGKRRCLRACDPNAKDPQTGLAAVESLCGSEYQCERSTFGDFRCLRAPLRDDLFAQCLSELQPYEIRAGDAFVVTGSQSGFFSAVEPDPTTRECRVPPGNTPYVRLRQSRIPAAGPILDCPPELTDVLDALPASFPSNVCRFTGSYVGGFTVGESIHFENPYFATAIQLNDPASLLSDELVASFQVVGAGFPLTVTIGSDVVAQQPRSVVTSPDRQTIYVVDEGKQNVATGLRGQLVRISSSALASDSTFLVR